MIYLVFARRQAKKTGVRHRAPGKNKVYHACPKTDFICQAVTQHKRYIILLPLIRVKGACTVNAVGTAYNP